MSLIYAIDPGTIQSALVVLGQAQRIVLGVGMSGRDTAVPSIFVHEHCTILNAALLPKLETAPQGSTLVIEQIEAMGMAVGHETFETVFWSGRFYEAWPNHQRYRLPRRPIKLHLCGSMQAKDANIRRALMDRFGGDSAIGTTKARGPLYGLKGHEFAALACGLVWIDQHPQSVALTQSKDAIQTGLREA